MKTNLFVPYELVLIAKEKGFNESCVAYLDIQDNNKLKFMPNCNEIGSFTHTNHLMIPVPIYQQVNDWLRNNHNIHVVLIPKAKYPDNFITGEYCVDVYRGSEQIEDDGVYLYYEAMKKGIEIAFGLI